NLSALIITSISIISFSDNYHSESRIGLYGFCGSTLKCKPFGHEEESSTSWFGFVRFIEALHTI
ncbi:3212_t:CDS:1, partial [Cetraspora pellucida]